MGTASKGPKLFVCPKCRKTYLGHDPLPDCPACGFDYRESEGVRWDVLVYLLSILGLISFYWFRRPIGVLSTERSPASGHSRTARVLRNFQGAKGLRHFTPRIRM